VAAPVMQAPKLCLCLPLTLSRSIVAVVPVAVAIVCLYERLSLHLGCLHNNSGFVPAEARRLAIGAGLVL
jgi:hypothetical protein